MRVPTGQQGGMVRDGGLEVRRAGLAEAFLEITRPETEEAA